MSVGRHRNRLLLPMVGRHLGREFLSAFGLTLAAFVGIYLVADFFDRLDTFLKHGASAGAIISMFLFKMPLIVAQVIPIAVLAAGLVGLGLLARQNEFVALRACGVSVWQMATPLLIVAGLISVGTFAWSETVVPYSARRWHQIEDHDIRQRDQAGVFTGHDVWYHGRAGFYSIDRVSLRRQTLYDLTIYQIGHDFLPVRLIEADAATWNGQEWHFESPRTREFGPDGVHEVPELPAGFALPETLDDFRTVSIEPEELSYSMLRRQIHDLRHKGVDASESYVDLHLKLALPAASFLMMLLAAPLATAGTRVSSLAASLGLGLVIGFAYFVVVALTRALGQTGALPPVVAAWTGNAIFALVGSYYLLGAE